FHVDDLAYRQIFRALRGDEVILALGDSQRKFAVDEKGALLLRRARPVVRLAVRPDAARLIIEASLVELKGVIWREDLAVGGEDAGCRGRHFTGRRVDDVDAQRTGGRRGSRQVQRAEWRGAVAHPDGEMLLPFGRVSEVKRRIRGFDVRDIDRKFFRADEVELRAYHTRAGIGRTVSPDAQEHRAA